MLGCVFQNPVGNPARPCGLLLVQSANLQHKLRTFGKHRRCGKSKPELIGRCDKYWQFAQRCKTDSFRKATPHPTISYALARQKHVSAVLFLTRYPIRLPLSLSRMAPESLDNSNSLPVPVPSTNTLIRRTQTTLGLLRDVVQESSAEYWYERGKAASATGNWAESAYAFSQCVSLSQKHWRGALQLAAAYAHINSLDKIISSILELCEYIKGEGEYYINHPISIFSRLSERGLHLANELATRSTEQLEKITLAVSQAYNHSLATQSDFRCELADSEWELLRDTLNIYRTGLSNLQIKKYFYNF